MKTIVFLYVMEQIMKLNRKKKKKTVCRVGPWFDNFASVMFYTGFLHQVTRNI